MRTETVCGRFDIFTQILLAVVGEKMDCEGENTEIRLN